jgi:hypothetical protein
VLVLLCAMVLTGIAALRFATDSRTQRASWTMIVGPLAMILPWPVLAVGFYTYVGASFGLGILLIGRGRVVGFALVAVGLVLPSFNTENEWALATVPVGILWIAFAIAVAWLGSNAPTTGARTASEVPGS